MGRVNSESKVEKLRQQGGPVLQRHDGIDLRIEPLDVIEIGAHDLGAGDPP